MTTATESDRVRLPLSCDAVAMAAEITALGLHDFLYYDVIALTVPRAKPASTPVTDYADGSWADWLDSDVVAELPAVARTVAMFRDNARVTLVRLLRLQAGAVIDEHCDPTLALEQERSVVRLTILIMGGDGVEFFLNDSTVPMVAGECWYLRLSDQHRVVHAGSETRVNLTIDMEPNEWLRDLIAEGDSLN